MIITIIIISMTNHDHHHHHHDNRHHRHHRHVDSHCRRCLSLFPLHCPSATKRRCSLLVMCVAAVTSTPSATASLRPLIGGAHQSCIALSCLSAAVVAAVTAAAAAAVAAVAFSSIACQGVN